MLATAMLFEFYLNVLLYRYEIEKQSKSLNS